MTQHAQSPHERTVEQWIDALSLGADRQTTQATSRSQRTLRAAPAPAMRALYQACASSGNKQASSKALSMAIQAPSQPHSHRAPSQLYEDFTQALDNHQQQRKHQQLPHASIQSQSDALKSTATTISLSLLSSQPQAQQAASKAKALSASVAAILLDNHDPRMLANRRLVRVCRVPATQCHRSSTRSTPLNVDGLPLFTFPCVASEEAKTEDSNDTKPSNHQLFARTQSTPLSLHHSDLSNPNINTSSESPTATVHGAKRSVSSHTRKSRSSTSTRSQRDDNQLAAEILAKLQPVTTSTSATVTSATTLAAVDDVNKLLSLSSSPVSAEKLKRRKRSLPITNSEVKEKVSTKKKSKSQLVTNPYYATKGKRKPSQPSEQTSSRGKRARFDPITRVSTAMEIDDSIEQISDTSETGTDTDPEEPENVSENDRAIIDDHMARRSFSSTTAASLTASLIGKSSPLSLTSALSRTSSAFSNFATRSSSGSGTRSRSP